ncbi:LysR family transcriptional regulator [Pelagibacterium luteolum]|uniref:DNA-binding transcriptional regulator, LysR family n=1 Tax=Pelagibacterium luteolum TaxID=440168 RepID=A0A1G7XUP6_9HYPH|nr:LysR family transcriptional regulator [Pelagibacterium luteolum]SDG87884.1 DNA-binding transcriptional regulator, LysR family [Pelagibacterium luteolum]
MELRQLSLFVAVAEELHFGRAAAKLNIAQPALSVQIQALERDLGVQLLTRTTRRVQLTKAGTVFYERSQRLLSDLDNSCTVVRAIAGKDIKKLTIGTIYPATFGVLPNFLAKISRRFPDIKVHVRTGTSEMIVREIELGHINLGFIRPLENIGSLRCLGIGNESYLLAMTNNSPLADKKTISLADLRSEKIIAFSRSNLSHTESHFYQLFREHGLLSSLAYTCDDTLSLVSMIDAGLGIGFVPEWTSELADRNLVFRKVEGVDFSVGLSIAWNKEDPTANRDEIVEMARSIR